MILLEFGNWSAAPAFTHNLLHLFQFGDAIYDRLMSANVVLRQSCLSAFASIHATERQIDHEFNAPSHASDDLSFFTLIAYDLRVFLQAADQT